ncbi:HEAT repeat domain-containing protein [Nocardia sp. NPDC003963]
MAGSSERRTIEGLVYRLDADHTDDAEDAKAEIIDLGRDTDVMTALLPALPELSRYGQLCAVEIIDELADPRAAPALIDLLGGEHDTVREWAARSLATLRITDAIPALRRAYQACRDRADPPDWCEPVCIRSALTDLGDRVAVTPALTAGLAVTRSYGIQAWPSHRLIDVLDDLAAHDQATLYFQLWRVETDGRMYRQQSPGAEDEVDYTRPWPVLVARTHDRATAAAAQARLDHNIVVTIEWIGSDDL